MKRFFLLTLIGLIVIGCSESDPPVVEIFRGNPIEGNLNGVLGVENSPYLAIDTLRVLRGQELVIEPGVEIRFDLRYDEGREIALPFEIYGKIDARGTAEAPITFTSGRQYPDRGDWEGVWMVDADPTSVFEYCRFIFGGKYGRLYRYRYDIGESDSTLRDSTLYEYGCLTLFRSNPTIRRSWFLAAGFHGVHCDSSNPIIENSVFYDNAGHGIYVHWTADPLIRYNNIIENDDYGIYFREAGDNPEPRDEARIEHNIIWSNFSGELNEQAPPGLGRIAQINGNLDSCDYQYNLRLNPAFIDAENWDFRLNPWSAAIDAGPESPGLRDPDGTRIELGIFPYHYRPGEIRRRLTVDRLETDRSPYFMSCDALLPAGQTLEIQPGVEVRVEGRFQFRIIGTLMAQGTADAPISLVSASEAPNKGDWLGLIFDAGGEDGSVLSHVTIAHTRWGVWLQSRDATIDHCRIIDADSVGILCDRFSAPLITDCEISNNSVAGILCQFNSDPKIRRNRIIGGAGYGIYCRESSLPEISNNIIYNIGTNAIRLENISSATVINNTIAGCGYFGIYCYNNSSPDIRNNIFYQNGTELRGGIGIIATRTSRPVIEYNGFWGHPGSAVSITSDTTAYNENINIMENPQFIDFEGGDFHLRAGSPYNDAGDPSISDPDGSRSDVGAYGGPWSTQ